MNELTRQSLYQYLLDIQAKIQSVLEVDEESHDVESLRGQWAIAQKIIEHFGLGPDSVDMQSKCRNS